MSKKLVKTTFSRQNKNRSKYNPGKCKQKQAKARRYLKEKGVLLV